MPTGEVRPGSMFLLEQFEPVTWCALHFSKIKLYTNLQEYDRPQMLIARHVQISEVSFRGKQALVFAI